MTEDRLAAIREAAEAGWRRADIKAHFRISDRALAKAGIKTNGHKVVRPGDGRLGSIIPPERVEMIRELSAAGVSERQIAQRMKLSCRQVRRTKQKHGIKALPRNERPRVEKPRKATKPNNGRNPMKDLNTWRPLADLTALDRAVSALRRVYCPVCAEDTIRKASAAPAPYTRHTLFRVGNRRNVTAAELMGMA